MRIPRDAYLKKLVRKQKNGLIKIVTGVRRCGKSYLLFEIFRDYLIETGIKEERIIQVALDDRRNKALRDADNMLDFITNKISDDGDYYIILDEVQFLEDFEDVLNSLLHIKNVDVYVTGSNSHFLSSDVVTQFRGRGDEIHVWPLSFAEFSQAHDGTFEQAWDDYMVYGGLPLVLSFDAPEDKANYLMNLFEKVYISDIVERNKVRNVVELDELVDVLASSIGSYASVNKLAKTFKSRHNSEISDKTIKKYIDYLQDSYLVNRAKKFDIKGRKYIGTPAKYYFEDVGLRNARLNFRQIEETHLMENVIYNELRIRGYSVDVGMLEVSENGSDGRRKKKQLEVDFIATKGAEKLYVQSALEMKTEEKIHAERRGLLKVSDFFKKMIVVGDDIKPRFDEDGIETVGLKHFLMAE